MEVKIEVYCQINIFCCFINIVLTEIPFLKGIYSGEGQAGNIENE